MREQLMEKLNVEGRRAEAKAQRESAKLIEKTAPRVLLRRGDARDLTWIPDESVHLVVTSPPYWTLKEYNDHPDQLGHVEKYGPFLDELEKVWRQPYRVLVPGGRVVCVVGDVCLSRRV